MNSSNERLNVFICYSRSKKYKILNTLNWFHLWDVQGRSVLSQIFCWSCDLFSERLHAVCIIIMTFITMLVLIHVILSPRTGSVWRSSLWAWGRVLVWPVTAAWFVCLWSTLCWTCPPRRRHCLCPNRARARTSTTTTAKVIYYCYSKGNLLWCHDVTMFCCSDLAVVPVDAENNAARRQLLRRVLQGRNPQMERWGHGTDVTGQNQNRLVKSSWNKT